MSKKIAAGMKFTPRSGRGYVKRVYEVVEQPGQTPKDGFVFARATQDTTVLQIRIEDTTLADGAMPSAPIGQTMKRAARAAAGGELIN